jgi:hypothetical protein
MWFGFPYLWITFTMEILLSAAYIVLFLWLISRISFFRANGLSPRVLGGIFLLKVFSGVGLWAIYTYYYKDRSTADIFKYFDDSKIMFDALHTHPADYFRMLFGIGNDTPPFDTYYVRMHNWARLYESNLYNDSHTIIRLNALLRLFSFGGYQVHSIFLCFFSLVGLVALYRSFEPFLPGRRKWLLIAIFLMPSVLFWGSGVLKEGLLFLGLGLLVFNWFRIFRIGPSILSVVLVIFSILLLLTTKFYVLVSITPGLIYMAWMLRSAGRRTFLKFSIVMVCYAGLGLGVKYFIPAYDPLQVLAIKQHDFTSLARGGALIRTDTAMVFLSLEQRQHDLLEIDHSKTYTIRQGTPFAYWHDYNSSEDTLFGKQDGPSAVFRMETDLPRSGSFIPMPPLEPTISSFLRNTPQALVNSFLRPFPTEARGPLLFMPTLEIGGYLIFIFLCLFFRRKNPSHTEYALFCLSFVFILFLITGLTTPVLGALVRYKVPGLPFLLISFLFILDEGAMEKRIPFIKRIAK